MGSDQLFQKKKIRREKELARTKAKKAPYETVLIVCEDSKSSPNYFKEMIKYFRLNTVEIVPSKGSAPISVVEHAIKISNKKSNFDRVYCVFDRDEHLNYDQALDKLKNLKKRKPVYKGITSIPCFEIWLLLHFSYTTKAYNRKGKKSAADDLISDLKIKLPVYEKSNTDWFNDLIDQLEVAIKNAKQLQEHNKKTDSENPATKVHELVEYLKHLQD